jgi:hypothetical protein
MAPSPFDLTVDGVATMSMLLGVTRLALKFDTVTLVRWLWTLVVGLSTVLFGVAVFLPPT